MKLFVVILLAVFCNRTKGGAVSLQLNLNAPIMAHVNMSSIKTYIDKNVNERLPALIKKHVKQMLSSEVERLTEHLTTTLQKRIGKTVDKTMQTKLNGFVEQLDSIEQKITEMVKSKIGVMSKQLTERMYELEQKENETMKNDTQELSEELKKSKNHCRGKCDTRKEMILPVDQLDNEFIIPIIQTRPKSTVRLLSPGKVKINVQLKDRHYDTHLNEGEYHDLIHNHISVVKSTGNLLVTVFPHEANGFDSYMMTVYGINRYKSDYEFIIPSDFSSFISITFCGDAIRGFEIDSHKMKADKVFEKTVNGKKYITFSCSIPEVAHIITNTNGIRFGLWLYGNRKNDGYGYPAGIAFRNKAD